MPDAVEGKDLEERPDDEVVIDDKKREEDSNLDLLQELHNLATKPRSVSFNRDVHVKRIAPARIPAPEGPPPVRKQSLGNLSKDQLAKEAQLVLEQAGNTTCHSTGLPPDRFHSLPVRGRKKKRPTLEINAPPTRRRSEDLGQPQTSSFPISASKSSLSRSVSDASSKRPKNSPKNNLLNLFKKSEKEDNLSSPKKSKVSVKRSKSDVSDLKSSVVHQRPVRKRTGSESEEYLNSVVGKKTQLSPIIEINQGDDYFRSNNIELISSKGNDKVDEVVVEIVDAPSKDIISKSPQEYKVNPIEKPPRIKDPKPPSRQRRSKTLTDQKPVNEKVVNSFNTLPKSRNNIRKKLFVDEIETKNKNIFAKDVKKGIKDTIDSLENRTQLENKSEMIHSSQKPPEKLPLTKGHTVDNMVRILTKDQFSPPPKASLLMPTNVAAHNNNQPFSYTKPSVSPDPNLYARSVSPERVPTPVNKMPQEPGHGVIYAQVVCGNGEKSGKKQTIHTSVSPGRHSDEDEGLGYEEHKYHYNSGYDQTDFARIDHKNSDFIQDSPITPRFKEFKSGSFDENCFDIELDGNRYLGFERGRGDGMDARRKDSFEESSDSKFEKKKAELSYRRELLESRIQARKHRDQISPSNMNGNKFSPERKFDVEEANPIEATKRYVSETKKYFRDDGHTKTGYSEDYLLQTAKNSDGTITKTENKSKSKYNPETAMFEPILGEDMDRREFIDRCLSEEPKDKPFLSNATKRYFPPEPDYEPPSLDSQMSGSRYSPEERKFKSKSSKMHSSSQDALSSHSKYINSKYKHDKFGSNRDHYASNPEILHRDTKTSSNDQYDAPETYHNSLRRNKHISSDKHFSQTNYLNTTSSRQQEFDDRKDLGYGGETSGPESSRSRCETDRDRDNKFADSGIENDFRKDSNGDIHPRKVVSSTSRVHKMRSRGDLRNESEDEGFASSLLIASERQHTEDNHSSLKQKYLSDYGHESSDFRHDLDYRNDNSVHKRFTSSKEHDFVYREKSIDDGSFYDPRIDKFEERKTLMKKVDSKPPKSNKKISGLEKMKQLFSRDSSKKSKKAMERSDVDMVNDQDLRRRYTEYRGPLDSDSSSKRRNHYRDDFDYSQRRRLATPSPSPSPPGRRDHGDRGSTPSTSWFKSLDRLSKKKVNKTSKLEKDSVITNREDEMSPKRYTTKNPSKNLRFFGDTDQESVDGSNSKHSNMYRKQTTDIKNERSTLSRNGKPLSNSVHALDRTDRHESKYKSSSMSNLQNGFDSRHNLLANSYNKEKYGNSRRDLHNISEIHSNSEDETHSRDSPKKDESTLKKPPMSPYKEKRRSRSHSASKTPVKNTGQRNGYGGSKGNLLEEKRDFDDKQHELRTSRQELMGSRNELRNKRRRIPHGGSPAGSSTEGESSLQSQRSVVYLHAPTVGDIPGSRMSRGRSRDDLSSVNSSKLQPQTKTVSRSFSVLAPWKPRHYREGYDINYSQSQHTTPRRTTKSEIRQPPKKDSSFLFGKSKSTSTKNLTSSKYDIRNNEDRSNHNTTLTRNAHSQGRPNGTLRKSEGLSKYSDGSKENINQNIGTVSRSRNDLRSREYKKSLSSEILERDTLKPTKRTVDRKNLSRSISMPKDPSKGAGWFKISKKSKKTESTNRLY